MGKEVLKKGRVTIKTEFCCPVRVFYGQGILFFPEICHCQIIVCSREIIPERECLTVRIDCLIDPTLLKVYIAKVAVQVSCC